MLASKRLTLKWPNLEIISQINKEGGGGGPSILSYFGARIRRENHILLNIIITSKENALALTSIIQMNLKGTIMVQINQNKPITFYQSWWLEPLVHRKVGRYILALPMNWPNFSPAGNDRSTMET